MAVPAGSLPQGWGVPASSPACPCLHRNRASLFWDSLGTPQTPLRGWGSIGTSVPVRAAASATWSSWTGTWPTSQTPGS